MTILRDAANILDTSEYDVFFQAYTHWYGETAPTDVINRAFSDYIKHQQTPHWARHYALDVIAGVQVPNRRKTLPYCSPEHRLISAVIIGRWCAR